MTSIERAEPVHIAKVVQLQALDSAAVCAVLRAEGGAFNARLADLLEVADSHSTYGLYHGLAYQLWHLMSAAGLFAPPASLSPEQLRQHQGFPF